MKLLEEELLSKFVTNKQQFSIKSDIIKMLYKEIDTMKATLEANNKKMQSEFEFWFNIMKKKYEYENKYGKIDVVKDNNANSDLQYYADRFNKTKSLINQELNKEN